MCCKRTSPLPLMKLRDPLWRASTCILMPRRKFQNGDTTEWADRNRFTLIERRKWPPRVPFIWCGLDVEIHWRFLAPFLCRQEQAIEWKYFSSNLLLHLMRATAFNVCAMIYPIRCPIQCTQHSSRLETSLSKSALSQNRRKVVTPNTYYSTCTLLLIFFSTERTQDSTRVARSLHESLRRDIKQ